MSQAPPPQSTIHRIEIAVRVGTDRMAGTDDPLFLELLGPSGREFRLALARGKQLRRGAEDHYVLAGPDDPDTNVDHPEMNDPSAPSIDLRGVLFVALRKGMEPIPNVRGFGEMDDRLQVLSVEVSLHVRGEAKPRRFAREGPFWLGLVSGQRVSIPPAESR